MNPTIRTAIAGSATAALLALSSPVALADTIYKWVDEKGVTQYGERPPSGREDSAKLVGGRSVAATRRPGVNDDEDEDGAGNDLADDADDFDEPEDGDDTVSQEGFSDDGFAPLTEPEPEPEAEEEADSGAPAPAPVATGGAPAGGDAGGAAGAPGAVGDDPLDQEAAKLQAQVREMNCKKAQKTLKVLEENARVRVKNAQGEYEYLTEPQHEEKKEEARKAIAENC